MERFNNNDKQRIAQLIADRITPAESGNKLGRKIGVTGGTITRTQQPHNWHMLSDEMWTKLANYVGYVTNNIAVWHHADTQVSRYLFAQFSVCQKMGMTAMLADDPGIGKTHSMREYARTHQHVMCIDCSVSNTKGTFIRAIAQAAGVAQKGRLQELLDASIRAILVLPTPLIILDESGDLEPGALLQLKKLYNALEMQCGFYMMGSDGFRSRIKRGVAYDKLGYTEIFSRFDKDFKRALSVDLNKKIDEYKAMASAICQANGVTDEVAVRRIIGDSFEGARGWGDLRRVKREIFKLRLQHENSH